MSRRKPEDEARQVLTEENVNEVEPIIQGKKPRAGASGGGACKVLTNVYPVQTRDIPVFRYEVLIDAFFLRRDGSFKDRLLTIRGWPTDAYLQDLYAKCREAFRKARAKDPVLQGGRLYYDLQLILYSMEKLKIPGELHQIQLEAAELDDAIFHGVSYVVVTVRKTEKGQLTLGDLTGLNTHLNNGDRSLLQFIDIATNQHAFFEEQTYVPFGPCRSYLVTPEDHGFQEEELAQFPENGTYLGMGVQKGAHWVEGPSKEGGTCIGMVVATKKTAFHGFETMFNKFKRLVHNPNRLQNGEADKVKRILTGLEFHTEHRGSCCRYVVKDILTDTNARQKLIEVDGKQVTVEAYFKQRYNIELKEPNTPLVETRGGVKGPGYYPIELCVVSDSQRVKTDQQTSRMMQEMIRKCAVPPAKHRDHVGKMFRALHLDDSEYLRDAEVIIHKEPAEVDARILRPPELVYAKGKQTQPAADGKWCDSQLSYYKPADCKQWVAYAYLGPRDRLALPDFMFTEMFANEALKRGMNLNPKPYKQPEIIATTHDDIRMLSALVEKEARYGCDFFLLIHGDIDDNTHALVKLMERRHSIATQEFRVTTVLRTVQKGHFQTVQNIVNKSNLKMSGLNYTLFHSNEVAKEIVGSDTLFIGVSVNHPSGGKKAPMLASKSDSGSKMAEQKSAPSVVGFAANVGRKDEFEFVGDFIYQEYNGEIDLRTMVGVVEQTLELHKKSRKRAPRRIVIYRNECSEGWFTHILQFEVPLLKEKLRKWGCADTKLTVIAVDKRQHIRFFKTPIDPRASKASEENVQPGLVVDKVIVHPIFCEFFLNSHIALQGTARTPKYTVLFDENTFPLAQLEEITYHLCYGHQIVSMPTSLPSPVYIANRYAERGRKVLTQRMRISKEDVDDFEKMTMELSYRSNDDLNMRRVNA